jgi:hypothetical protein
MDKSRRVDGADARIFLMLTVIKTRGFRKIGRVRLFSCYGSMGSFIAARPGRDCVDADCSELYGLLPIESLQGLSIEHGSDEGAYEDDDGQDLDRERVSMRQRGKSIMDTVAYELGEFEDMESQLTQLEESFNRDTQAAANAAPVERLTVSDWTR